MIDSDMKKITNLLYMLAVLLLASCSDFLDKSPKNTVDPETTVTDDVAIALTNACYRTLQSSNMYNQRIWTLDIVAGNSLVGAGGGTDGLETIQASNFITQSDNGMALYMWRSPWVGIGQCNIVLNSLLELKPCQRNQEPLSGRGLFSPCTLLLCIGTSVRWCSTAFGSL
mgnify:CR=1 FL=1